MRPIEIVTPNEDALRATEQSADDQQVVVLYNLYVRRAYRYLQLFDVIILDVQNSSSYHAASISQRCCERCWGWNSRIGL